MIEALARRIAVLAVISLAATAAGCGGTSGPAAAPPIRSTASAAPAATVPATLSVAIEGPKPSAAARRTRYVSPATAFIQIEINHATTQTFPLSAGTPCTPPPPGATTCLTFAFNAPIGTDTFVVTAFLNGTTILAQATTQATIVAGVANVVTVTLDARVASVALSLTKPAPPQGTATRGLVLVTPLDAAGDSPVGSPGALPPVTVTDGDGSGATALYVGTDTTCATAAGAPAASVTATQSGTGYVPVCMSYSGGALAGGATITATIAGVAPVTTTFKPAPAGTVSPGAWIPLTRFDASLNVVTSIGSGLPGPIDGLDVDQNDNVYALSGPLPSTPSTYQISAFSDSQSGSATPFSATQFVLPSDTTLPASDGIAGPALDGSGNAYVLGLRPGLSCTIYRIPLTGGTVAPIPAVNCGGFINPTGSRLHGFRSDAQGRVYVGFDNHVGPSNPGPSVIYRLTRNPDATLATDSSTGGGYEITDLALTPAGNIDALVDFGRVVVIAGSSFGSSWKVIDTYDAVAFNALLPPLVVDHAGNLFVAGKSGSVMSGGAGFTFAVIPAGTHATGAASSSVTPSFLGAAR